MDRVGWLSVVALVLACGPVVPIDDGGSSTGDPSGPTTTVGSTTLGTTTSVDTSVGTTFGTTSPGTSVGTTPVDTGETIGSETWEDTCGECGCAFIDGCWSPDGGGSVECDVWAQDCPEGEKCMPWANDGGAYWNATRCSPIDPAGALPGEPCMVEGSYVSGIDNCILGAQCMWVDPITNVGTCAANCDGSEADPSCIEPGFTCDLEFEGTIHACLPSCDPLAQDCIEGATCVPATLAGQFVCAPALAPTIGEHEPCDSVWDCVPGNVCLGADLDPDCAGERCCFSYCNLVLGDAYCEGQSCVPWFEDGQAPPGLENVGVCLG